MVSVIMPAYNSDPFIAEAIRSVQSQSYPYWELMVIDDGSRDKTSEIVKNYSEKDVRIHLFTNQSNKGTAYSRNRGIKEASGRFIAFLDADDQWKPEKLEKQLKWIKQKDIGACFSSYDLISEDGKRLNKKITALPVLNFEKLLKANYVGNLTGIYDLQKIGKVYCPDIPKRQDWALWLEVIKRAGKMEGIKESLALYRLRKDSISRNKLEMLKYNFQVYHKVLGYSFFKSIWKMILFLNEQLLVKSKQVRSISPKK